MNAQTLRKKTSKINKKILKDAKKSIKKEQLFDSHGLEVYLSKIDSQYEHIKARIENSTRMANYSGVRAKKIAETRALIDFYDEDYHKLESLRAVVSETRPMLCGTPSKNGRIPVSADKKSWTPPDMTKIKKSFASIADEEI